MKSLSTLYKMKEEADYQLGEAENTMYWIEDQIKEALKKRRAKLKRKKKAKAS